MDLLRDIKPDWLRKGSLRVDYQETFAPVAKRNSICILLSCAANLGWSTTISLVKNAFLHGNLKEEVYMEIPPGFSSQKSSRENLQIEESTIWLEAITESLV